MSSHLLAVEPVLLDSRRLPAFGQAVGSVHAAELACLAAVGLLAAAGTVMLDLSLRIPGHAIFRAVFPLALGLALVPRRGAGQVLAAVSVTGGVLFQGLGFGSAGAGALTSLFLSGVLLDLAARRARSGWQLYAGLALAGLATNSVAFAVKLLTKLVSIDGGPSLAAWWPRAVVTYPLCGALAGLLAAAVLFRPGQVPRPR